MPNWLVPVLKWGGVALAVVAAAALIYVQLLMPAPEEAAEVAAPLTLYWILLVVGVVVAIVGFVMEKRAPQSEA